MSFLDDILALSPTRAWPVGKGTVSPWETSTGHDDTRFAPETYEDYIATSNEIYSVASMRARLVSGLDLNLFRGRGSEKKALPEHAASRLLQYVNPYWTRKRLERIDELSMCIWGETAWALEPGPGRSKEPGEIWWLKPSRLLPAPHETDYLSGHWYYPQMGGEPIFFRHDEVVWFRYPNPIDEFSALSPLSAARLAADVGKSMMQSNGAMFENGLQIAGIITPPADKVTFSKEQAAELERKLDVRFKGAKNAKKWAVLRYEAQFKQMSITPKDAEFLGGLSMSLRQVCNAYGIPSSLLNDIEHSNMAILGELVRAMWSHTLVPDTQLRTAEIEEQFLPRFHAGGPDHAAYDYSSVEALQESETERWAREAQAIDRGRYTVNEIRKMAGEPAVPWGDVWWAPVNKFAVTDAESKPPSNGGDGAAPKPPDDERNPANKPPTPRGLDHMAARRLLSSLNGRSLAGV
jgi:HK97 family phage portal protein